jgi:hypothetical protein
MIPQTIKDTFLFIDYLHSNIDNFNSFNELQKEISLLREKKFEVRPKKTYSQKLEYDKLEKKINKKGEILEQNVINPITNKAISLNVLAKVKDGSISLDSKDIDILKQKVETHEVKDILKQKNKYLEFRSRTNKTNYLSFDLFFPELDDYLIQLFEYFTGTDIKEFDFLKSDTIQVDTIEQAVGLIYPKTRQDVYRKLHPYWFFKFETNNERKQIDLVNWEATKEAFYSYKMSLYDNKYTKGEKLEDELTELAKIDEDNHEIKKLKRRYLKFLDIQLKKSDCENLENWFFVGLKFAKGEIDDLYENSHNFSEVTRIIIRGSNYEEKGIRPYISESFSNSGSSDKNIFASDKKIEKIKKYCSENDILIVGRKFIESTKTS